MARIKPDDSHYLEVNDTDMARLVSSPVHPLGEERPRSNNGLKKFGKSCSSGRPQAWLASRPQDREVPEVTGW